jgi:hypothetical protein
LCFPDIKTGIYSPFVLNWEPLGPHSQMGIHLDDAPPVFNFHRFTEALINRPPVEDKTSANLFVW